MNGMAITKTSAGDVLNCTIDTTDNKGKMLILNAINSAQSLNSLKKGSKLKVTDCIQLIGIRKGRGNNVDTECVNTYLIDVDGNAYFTQSDGIARSVKMTVELFPDFGRSTEKGYLEVAITEQELANGNTLKSLKFIF